MPDATDASTLVKNTDGFLVSKVDGTKYSFDATRRLKSITDRHGNTISFDNTVPGTTTITDSAGRKSVVSYNTSNGRVTSIKDPAVNTYDFAYNASGLLWKVTYPAPSTAETTRPYWEYLYYPSGLIQYKIDPEGHIVQYTYDGQGRVTQSVDPNGVPDTFGNVVLAGHTKSLAFNTPTTGSTTFTEKDGGQWIYTYDTQTNAIKEKINPNGNRSSFYYYADSTLKAKTEPFDGTSRLTTFYTYDSHGNLLTKTNPVDISVYSPAIDPATVDVASLANYSPPIKTAFRYAYDLANSDRLISVSDEQNTTPNTTTNFYTTENGGDVVTVVTTPGNITTITKYNPNGTVREIIDANQKSTTFTYYPDTTANRSAGIVGLLWTSTGPDGVTTSVTSYDKNGNPLEIKISDTAGKVKVTSAQEHDALNRLRKLTKLTASLSANITQYGYNNVGELKSVIDAETHPTTYDYNYNHQVTKITDASQNDTVFSYSGSGCASCGGGADKLTGVYDAKFAKNTPLDSQPHTAYSYDKLGRLEYETDPVGKRIHYTYYDNGLLKNKYNASATPEILLFTYFYNNLGEVTDRIYTDGRTDHYEYNANGSLASATTSINGVTVVSYSYVYYDDGRLQSVTDTNNGRTISYDLYDNLGQKKQMTIMAGTPDQRVISYDYDSANRPWHIYTDNGNKVFQFDYDSLGRRQTLTYPNQTTASYVYDDLNRLTSLTHSAIVGPTIEGIEYSEHDAAGNRKYRTATDAEGFLYDSIYRLLTVTAAKPEAFAYDVVGNRQTGPGAKDTGARAGDTTYLYNDANQLLRGRKLEYAYDDAGNQITRSLPVTSDKSWTQTWDYENRLVKVEKVKGAEKRTVTFTYDPLGRRIGKQVTTVIDGIVSASNYAYLYDDQNIVMEVSGTTTTHYTHGPGIDEHLALEHSGSFYYYHADGLGSIVAITDQDKNVVQHYEYDSFGMAKPTTDFANSYTYTGREWDKETGLYYYRARYYDPMDGRFVSKDPIGYKGGINVYAYVRNNPVNRKDPNGLFDWPDALPTPEYFPPPSCDDHVYCKKVSGIIGIGADFVSIWATMTGAGAPVGAVAAGVSIGNTVVSLIVCEQTKLAAANAATTAAGFLFRKYKAFSILITDVDAGLALSGMDLR